MNPTPPLRPLNQAALIDQDFLEHRHKLLDIAAFLDRLDRAPNPTKDYRIQAFQRALTRVATPETDRATAVQMLFSDPRPALLDHSDQKKAVGASPHQENPAS